MIVERIHEALRARAAQRAERPRAISAWNAGHCPRELYYIAHGVPPDEPLGARALLVFDLGDRVEDSVTGFVESVVPTIRTDRRADNMDVPGMGFRCRPDFVFEAPDELRPFTNVALESGDVALAAYAETPPAKGELIGGECKSMSDFAFQRAQRGQLDESYLAQIECNLRALPARWWLCLAYRKSTSHVAEVWVCRDDARWERVRANVAAARGDAVPERPYALDDKCAGAATGDCVNGLTPGRGIAHKKCGGSGKEPGGPYIPNWPCGWCANKVTCWRDVGELELTFREGKPRWRIKS